MAVSSYLKLIKNLRISNMNAVSQTNNSSTYSFLTQMSMQNQVQLYNKFSNEALCLEVLDILRRCFMQQAEVRTELYDGMYFYYFQFILIYFKYCSYIFWIF